MGGIGRGGGDSHSECRPKTIKRVTKIGIYNKTFLHGRKLFLKVLNLFPKFVYFSTEESMRVERGCGDLLYNAQISIDMKCCKNLVANSISSIS